MPSNAYAKRTKVSEERSRSEIEAELRKHDCSRIGVITEPELACFCFARYSRTYQVSITLPKHEVAGGAAERRRRMRTLLLYIKGRLNAVRDGVKTFEQEFLPEAVLADGRTVAEHAAEQLTAIEGSGGLPNRLMLPGAIGG